MCWHCTYAALPAAGCRRLIENLHAQIPMQTQFLHSFRCRRRRRRRRRQLFLWLFICLSHSLAQRCRAAYMYNCACL